MSYCAGAEAPRPRTPRPSCVGDVRLGQLRVPDHGHRRRLPHLLQPRCGRRVGRRSRAEPVLLGLDPGHRGHGACGAGAGCPRGRQADQEDPARHLRGHPRGCLLRHVVDPRGRLDPGADLVCHRQHRGGGQHRVLRIAAAVSGGLTEHRSGLDRRVRDRLYRRGIAAGDQPPDDPTARVVRPAGRGSGHASLARLGRRLVARVFDSAVPARGGTAHRAAQPGDDVCRFAWGGLSAVGPHVKNSAAGWPAASVPSAACSSGCWCTWGSRSSHIA